MFEGGKHFKIDLLGSKKKMGGEKPFLKSQNFLLITLNTGYKVVHHIVIFYVAVAKLMIEFQSYNKQDAIFNREEKKNFLS